MTIVVGNGSGGAVTRVASGCYAMVYADTPTSVAVLKKSGVTTPFDLSSKKLGALVLDAGRRALPIFAIANSNQRSFCGHHRV